MNVLAFFGRLFQAETAQEMEERIRRSIEADNLGNLRYERRFIPSERTRAEVLTRE